jgi:hypothetical protein
MEAVQNWTREYFINNHDECIKKLNELTDAEKDELRNNLHFNEQGLVLLNHFMVSDVKEPEYYCEKYEVKKSDGSTRMENAKYSDQLKLNIQEDESCENPAQFLSERQTCIVKRSESNNVWIKEHECITLNANKRKIESVQDQSSYLVKVYDSTEILLNQLVEIVGFLSTTPVISADAMDEDGGLNEQQATLPKFVIHAISFKEQTHNNPLLYQQQIENDEQQFDVVQKDLLNVLTQLLFGDTLSAHYLLCHLISTVYSRVNEEALGKFALNLICHSIPSNIMTEYVKRLYNFIEVLIPNSLYIPLSIENLNNTDFVPKKDYTTNNLSTATLQLPKSTHLLLDETKLENGKLEQNGCLAIGHFAELIKNQKLSYDFMYYKIPFNTDYPVLIVSEGKSLLPVS